MAQAEDLLGLLRGASPAELERAAGLVQAVRLDQPRRRVARRLAQQAAQVYGRAIERGGGYGAHGEPVAPSSEPQLSLEA
ncbi:MAG: hypothetical protein ACE15B_15900 [Bryobacteraceae bacterium]